MGPRTILFILTSINLLNYIDRWLLAAIIPAMQKDLAFSNTTAGFIMSAFMLGYFATSPLFGYLADRTSRVKLISIGTALWSAVTVLSGFGKSGLQIFLFRTFVGVGEASSAASVQPLATDIFPHHKRNQVMAILTAAIPVGSALGFVLGGLFESKFGWRQSFFILGAPGFLAALLILLVKEPKRGALDQKASEKARPSKFKSDVLRLLKNKSYMNTVWGYTAFTFTVGGFASWAPHYLVTMRGLPLTQADTTFGALTVVTGTVGSLLGGFGATYFSKKRPQGDLWFVVITTALAIPFAFLSFWLDKPLWFFTAMGFTEFFLFLGQPTVNVVVLEAVSPFMRGTAMALCIFFIHLFGDLISPPLVGFLADTFNLQIGVQILPAVLFLALFFYWKSYKSHRLLN